jgi:hypothetical protein
MGFLEALKAVDSQDLHKEADCREARKVASRDKARLKEAFREILINSWVRLLLGVRMVKSTKAVALAVY